MNKTVFVFIRSLLKGGAEKQSILLAKKLNSRYNVHLVVLHGDQVENENLSMINESNINVHRLRGSIVKKIYKYYRLTKNLNPYVTFSYLTSDNLIAAIIGKWCGIRHIIVGVRSMKLDVWREWVMQCLHRLLQSYTLFNNYTGAEKYIREGLDSSGVVVIPNGIEVCQPPIERPRKNPIEIVSVGRFVQSKDYRTALNAFSRLRQNHQAFTGKGIRYTIVGYGPLEGSIRQYIRQKDLSDHVSVVVLPSDLRRYYKSADIYLNTSMREGTSNTILEAMSYSLPVIATEAGDNRFLVEDGVTGYIEEVGDPVGLSRRLKQLVDSHDKRLGLGIRGYRKVKKEFSAESLRRQYVQLIESLED